MSQSSADEREGAEEDVLRNILLLGEPPDAVFQLWKTPQLTMRRNYADGYILPLEMSSQQAEDIARLHKQCMRLVMQLNEM